MASKRWADTRQASKKEKFPKKRRIPCPRQLISPGRRVYFPTSLRREFLKKHLIREEIQQGAGTTDRRREEHPNGWDTTQGQHIQNDMLSVVNPAISPNQGGCIGNDVLLANNREISPSIAVMPYLTRNQKDSEKVLEERRVDKRSNLKPTNAAGRRGFWDSRAKGAGCNHIRRLKTGPEQNGTTPKQDRVRELLAKISGKQDCKTTGKKDDRSYASYMNNASQEVTLQDTLLLLRYRHYNPETKLPRLGNPNPPVYRPKGTSGERLSHQIYGPFPCPKYQQVPFGDEQSTAERYLKSHGRIAAKYLTGKTNPNMTSGDNLKKRLAKKEEAHQ